MHYYTLRNDIYFWPNVEGIGIQEDHIAAHAETIEKIIKFRKKFYDKNAMNPKATSLETDATIVPDSQEVTGGVRQGTEREEQKYKDSKPPPKLTKGAGIKEEKTQANT